MTTPVLNPFITAVGLALAPAPETQGVHIQLTHIALGTGKYTPAVDANGAATQTALQNEVARYSITSGTNPAPHQVQLGLLIGDTDDTGRSPNGKEIGEIGFYAGNTLFAVWSQASGPLFVKTASVDVPFAYTLDVSILPPNSVTVVVGTDTLGMQALILAHEAKPDPHVQYVLKQRGIGEYDALTIYDVGARVLGPDGKTYKSLVANNVGFTPAANPTKWDRWGFTLAELDAEFVPKRAGLQVGAANAGVVRVQNPDGALYAGASTGTGAIKITLPTGAQNSMLRLRVEIFDYALGESFTLLLAGYVQTNLTWNNQSVAVVGSRADRDFAVRFGNDGTKPCIWIGELASTWSYLRAWVAEAMVTYNGDGGTVARWNTGWTMGLATAFEAVEDTITGSLVFGQSDIARVSGLQAALDLKAPLASPALTGSPTAPTAATGTNTTQLATTAFVAAAIANLIASAPGALDTLNELATALGNDPNFAATVTNALALKAPLASPALTGTPTVPTAAAGTNTTQAASTGFVMGQIATATPQPLGTAAVGSGTKFARDNHVHAMPTLDALANTTITSNSNGEILRWDGAAWVNNTLAEAGIAPANSPALTGIPTAPTAAPGTNTTQVSTTAFVQAAIAALVNASPGTLDTLNELAAALGDDPNFATTMTNALALKAPLASPAMTGTPTAPTATSGNNGTQLATTGFVQVAANGLLSKSVAGAASVTLTAAEAGYATLKFTGALTANIDVIVPATASRWTIWNATTGAFTLRVKTAAGTGVLVTQGTTWQLLCDGTNVVDANSDFKDIALTGVPTAPTAAVGTSTTQLATTAFVQQEITNDLAGAAPPMDGAAAVGTSTKLAREDHRHPTDTTRAPLASPTFTGTPAAPTAAVGTNTTQLATTAFVATAITNLIASSPAALDTLNELAAALGDDPNFATTVTNALALKAPLASPIFTGTPGVPTAAGGTNTTQAASTAFVQAALAAAGFNTNAAPSTGDLNAITLGGAYRYTGTATGSPVANESGTVLHLSYSATYWAQIALHIGQGTTVGNRVFYRSNVNGVLQAWQEIAFLNSPTFTGTPQAPTAAAGTNTTQLATTAFVQQEMAADLATAAPLMDGAVAVGTATKLAREDHRHPTDTTRAPLASPAFTGTPTVPTAAAGTNTGQAASTAFVMAALAALVDSSPGTLDTLNELAAALGDDPNFATTMTNALAARALLAGNAAQVFSVANATANAHAVSRSFGDSRYLLQSGGTVAGTLTSQGGIYMVNNVGYRVRTTGGTDLPVMYADAGNVVVFGNAALPTFVTGSTVSTVGAVSLGAQASAAAHAVRYDQTFGLGQTLQNVTASRALGTTYTNSTGKPIIVHVTASAAAAGSSLGFFTGGFEGSISTATAAGNGIGITSVVQPGGSYAIIQSGGATLQSWIEIR